jgi:hypothetical protein
MTASHSLLLSPAGDPEKPGQGPTHLTLGFQGNTRTRYGGPYQVTRSRPSTLLRMLLSSVTTSSPCCLSFLPAHHAGIASGMASVGPVSKPFFQVTSWAPFGTSPVSRKRHKATNSLRANATIPMRRWRLLPLPNRC